MMPLTLPSPASADRSRLMPVDVLRRQALARLYERRETVENLIRSLEDYQRSQDETKTVRINEISVRRKCLSDSARLQI